MEGSAGFFLLGPRAHLVFWRSVRPDRFRHGSQIKSPPGETWNPKGDFYVLIDLSLLIVHEL